MSTLAPEKIDLLPGACQFNQFLLHMQQTWAQRLIALETRSTWQVEHRPSPTHDSQIYQISGGDFLEKGAINYSCITGDALPVHALGAQHQGLGPQPFVAMGISMILHPLNPFVPTVHANLRYFQTQSKNPIWWFAGVMDLTPTYGFDEDCKHWHQTCRQACLSVGDHHYPAYKEACDRYYYLPHRKEHRGIGGLWIEQHNKAPFDNCQRLIESLGKHFLPAYLPIAKQRLQIPYSEHHRNFQAHRRSRYVEFNLLYDRGTKFGLSMDSRAESILLSMPPQASWPYNWKAKPDSAEAKLRTHYLQPQNWCQNV